MRKFLVIVCLFIICNVVQARSRRAISSDILFQAKENFDSKIFNYIRTLQNLDNDVANRKVELKSIMTRLIFSLALLFRLPIKYAMFSGGHVYDFRTLINFFELRTCPNYYILNNAITTMKTNLKVATEFPMKQSTFRNIETKLSARELDYGDINGMQVLGDRCISDFNEDYSDAVNCLERIQEKFGSKIETYLAKYGSNYNSLVGYVTQMGTFEDKYVAPARVAYNRALSVVDTCLNYKGIQINI